MLSRRLKLSGTIEPKPLVPEPRDITTPDSHPARNALVTILYRGALGAPASKGRAWCPHHVVRCACIVPRQALRGGVRTRPPYLAGALGSGQWRELFLDRRAVERDVFRKAILDGHLHFALDERAGVSDELFVGQEAVFGHPVAW